MSISLGSAKSKVYLIEILLDFLDAVLTTPNLPVRKYETLSELNLSFRKRTSWIFVKKFQTEKSFRESTQEASYKSSNNLISKRGLPGGGKGERQRRTWELPRARY